MEHLWSDRSHVWLRSGVHGGYLHADADGVGVSVRGQGRRASLHTAWEVHVDHPDAVYLLLRSAAYGRYLAASARPAPRAHRGFCVVQRNYDRPQQEAILWQVIPAGSGDGAVLLRSVGGRYLRANGKVRRWNRGVTVDEFENVSNMMHWVIEPIPVRRIMPLLQDPVREGLPGDLSVILRFREAAAWQVIRFVLATNDGLYTEEEGWSDFRFRGRSVYHLRNELARRLGLLDRVFSLILCVRAGRYGRLTPLSENLPRDGHGVTIEIVIIRRGTPAAYELRHPRVDAE